MRKRWVRILLFVLAWVAIGFVFSWQLRLLALNSGFTMSWFNILSWELTRWCLWIFLFPLVLRTIQHAPQFPGSKKRFFLTNGIASIIISLFHMAIFTIVYWYVIRLIEGFEAGLSITDALFGEVPKAIQRANLRLDKIFGMIFAIDFHIGILIYWIILAGYQALDYSRRASELKTQLAQAQLDALKMQLHPHFLFNTLNSISALIHKNPEDADEMIGELGNFLRLTLQSSSGLEVTLEEELRFLSSYLEIERIRFRNRLEVEMQIDPETLPIKVPNLILQPIIENAIRHGIAHIHSGRIAVHSSKNDHRLLLQVVNDGPELSDKPLNGIGLSNVQERLRRLYDGQYDFRISNRAEGGVSVELAIPIRDPGVTT
jgi:sensor histidine kinase YesM